MKKTNNIIGFLFIALLPFIVLIMRYHSETEKTIQVESGLGFIGTTIAIILSLGLSLFIINNFRNHIKNHPFSTEAILSYGITLGVFLYITRLIINYVNSAVKSSVETFLEASQYHYTTLTIMLLCVIFGGLIVLINYLYYKFKTAK